jgi:hypothetical protein
VLRENQKKHQVLFDFHQDDDLQLNYEVFATVHIVLAEEDEGEVELFHMLRQE